MKSHDQTVSPNYHIETTEIEDLLIYKRETFEDERGFFKEVLELRDLEKVLGKKINITQWNHSKSYPNVIRGFHNEPWEKIVYAVNGEAIAVIVDLRTESKTFGKAVKISFGEYDKKAIYIPEGLGNSFCAIGKENLEYMYLITGYYENKPYKGVFWNDPLITKQFGGWPVENPIISDRDKNYPTLKERFENEVDFSKFPWLNG